MAEELEFGQAVRYLTESDTWVYGQVIEVGVDENAGQIKVKWDDGYRPTWIRISVLSVGVREKEVEVEPSRCDHCSTSRSVMVTFKPSLDGPMLKGLSCIICHCFWTLEYVLVSAGKHCPVHGDGPMVTAI